MFTFSEVPGAWTFTRELDERETLEVYRETRQHPLRCRLDRAEAIEVRVTAWRP